MKTVIATIALAIALATSAAYAQTRTFHDQGGRVTGKARTDANGTTGSYDAAGRVTGESISIEEIMTTAKLRPGPCCPAFAKFERDPIQQRTSEGRARAMAEGTRFGRKPKMTKHQQREVLKRVAAGETLREIALSYNVDHATIQRLKARYAAEA